MRDSSVSIERVSSVRFGSGSGSGSGSGRSGRRRFGCGRFGLGGFGGAEGGELWGGERLRKRKKVEAFILRTIWSRHHVVAKIMHVI